MHTSDIQIRQEAIYNKHGGKACCKNTYAIFTEVMSMSQDWPHNGLLSLFSLHKNTF